jgi:hypothetical protein
MNEKNLNQLIDQFDESLQNEDLINEDLLKKLQEQVDRVKLVIKEKNKPKTITISGNVHNSIKKYCNYISKQIGDWAEEILLKEISKSTIIPETKEEYEENIKKEILDNYYKRLNSKKTFIKSNTILSSRELNFRGYSQIDGFPIYQFMGDNLTYFIQVNNLLSMGLGLKTVPVSEISETINSNPKLENVIVLDSFKFNLDNQLFEGNDL